MAQHKLLAALLPALLIGCGNKEDESDNIIITDSSIDGILDSLPACETIAADGRLNVVSGCADGACVGMTYDDVVDVMGEYGACEPTADGAPSVQCTWEGVVEITFDDLDDDFTPDKGDMIDSIRLLGEYPGGTAEGLGLGASTSCFIEQYGEPDLATWTLVYDHYVLLEATWIGWGLTIVDDDGPPGDVDPDGYVDHLSVAGAL
jgi:hypothetical protein